MPLALFTDRYGPLIAIYFVENSEFLKSLILERGRLIFLCQGSRRQRRIIAGVNETSLGNVQFIAPKRTTRIKRNSEYVKWRDVPIRPGSMVLGGRNTAFYDNYGVILDAFPTGGNHEKFEDWIYRVAAPLYSAWSATAQWILIDDIGPDVQGPGSLIELSPHPNSLVDGFLGNYRLDLAKLFA